MRLRYVPSNGLLVFRATDVMTTLPDDTAIRGRGSGRTLGAEVSQGFYFAPPLTGNDFGEYLRRTVAEGSSTSAASA